MANRSFTKGDTWEELMANLKDAIAGWIEVANENQSLEATDQVVEIAV
ncbi:hypothetical protein [Gloeocapsopsis dulcis]|nr:hypothetical protein [Gloeocapsopsis dulcis]WNN91107.1 hypothetical protein P0S91_08530 [Gloeocapsopsis dulcis]